MIDLCKRCHYTCVEALNNFRLHSKSILYIKSVWAPSDTILDMHNDASSHHHHHNCFPIFWRADWTPRWWTCANNATALVLRPLTASDCITHLSCTYIRWFEHLLVLWMGMRMNPHTINTTNVVSNFWELAEILMIEMCKQCHYMLPWFWRRTCW